MSTKWRIYRRTGPTRANALQFPVQIGDPVQNATAVQTAQADAQSARTYAMIGIAIGIVGLLVGLAAIAFTMRRPPAPTLASATTRPASERA